MKNKKSDNQVKPDDSMLGALLAKPRQNNNESTSQETIEKPKPKPKPKADEVGEKQEKKERMKSESFTLTIQPDTIQKFNEIQWLKQFVIDFTRVTRDDVLKEALDALGEKMGYDELMKQHKDKMKGNISPPPGRTAK